MTRAPAVLLLLVLLLAVYALMYAGWSRRRRRHPAAAVAARAPDAAATPEAAAEGATGEQVAAAEGIYVSTVSAGSRHDRVTAAGLGARSRARMVVHTSGVRWHRQGADVVSVDAPLILGAGRSAGMAGKFLGQQRLVTVTWRAGDGSAYDTGFLPRYRSDGPLLLAALELAMGAAPAPPGASDPGRPSRGPGSDRWQQAPQPIASAEPDGAP